MDQASKMTMILLQFIFSAGMIFVASRWLTRAADGIARSTRLGHFLVGSLFLAASTSAPEFFVDLHATVLGAPNLAAGDLMGSSIVNLAILSFCILIYHRHLPEKFQNITWPAVLSILLTAIVALAIVIPMPQLWNIGLGSYFIVATYALGVKFLYKADIDRAYPQTPHFFFKSVILFLVATVILFFTAPILVESMTTLCHMLEIDHTFMGATLLALTTSLPELFTSIIAARAGLFDLILGNIIGSNAFNMIIFSFMDLIWRDGSIWSQFSKQHLIAAFAVIANMSLLIVTARHRGGTRTMLFGALIILISSSICYILLYSY